MNVKRKNGCNILIQIIIIGKRKAKWSERLSSIKINIKHKTLPIWHFYFVLNIHNIEYRIIGWKRQIGPDIELRKEENQYFVIQGNLYHSLPPPFTLSRCNHHPYPVTSKIARFNPKIPPQGAPSPSFIPPPYLSTCQSFHILFPSFISAVSHSL